MERVSVTAGLRGITDDFCCCYCMVEVCLPKRHSEVARADIGAAQEAIDVAAQRCDPRRAGRLGGSSGCHQDLGMVSLPTGQRSVDVVGRASLQYGLAVVCPLIGLTVCEGHGCAPNARLACMAGL